MTAPLLRTSYGGSNFRNSSADTLYDLTGNSTMRSRSNRELQNSISDEFTVEDADLEKALVVDAIRKAKWSGRAMFFLGTLYYHASKVSLRFLSRSDYAEKWYFEVCHALGSLLGGVYFDAKGPFAVERAVFVLIMISFVLSHVAYIISTEGNPTTVCIVVGTCIGRFCSGMTWPLVVGSHRANKSVAPLKSQQRFAVAFAMYGGSYLWLLFNVFFLLPPLQKLNLSPKILLLIHTLLMYGPIILLCVRTGAIELNMRRFFCWKAKNGKENGKFKFQVATLEQLRPPHSIDRIVLELKVRWQSIVVISFAVSLWRFCHLAGSFNLRWSFASHSTNTFVDLVSIQFILVPFGVFLGYVILSRFPALYVLASGSILTTVRFAMTITMSKFGLFGRQVVKYIGTGWLPTYAWLGTPLYVVVGIMAPKRFAGSFAGIVFFVSSLVAGVEKEFHDTIKDYRHEIAIGTGVCVAVISICLIVLNRRQRSRSNAPVHVNSETPERREKSSSLTFTRNVKRDDFIVPYENLVLGKWFAAGAQGRVRKAVLSGTPVAVKEVFDTFDGSLATFNDEAEIMAKLQHPSVARFFGVSTKFDSVSRSMSYYLVSEWCDGGNMIDAVSSKVPTYQTKLRWSWNLCEAIWYFHNRHEPVVHFDIKPQNILLTSQDYNNSKVCELRVCDLGEARVLQGVTHGVDVEQEFGTIPYFPPELMRFYRNRSLKKASLQAGPYTVDGAKVDTFCVGLVIMYMFTGVQPYERGKSSVEEIIDHSMKGSDPGMYDFKSIPTEICTIVTKMLAYRAEDRPSMKTAAMEFELLVKQTK